LLFAGEHMISSRCKEIWGAANMRESTVTTKGQTTLPKEVRKALGLQPGDKLRYILLEEEVRLLRARPVLDLEGALKRPGQKTVTLEEMEEAIAAGAVDLTQ
jgi:AbrB family looped-hinge helix DNA binding protein